MIYCETQLLEVKKKREKAGPEGLVQDTSETHNRHLCQLSLTFTLIYIRLQITLEWVGRRGSLFSGKPTALSICKQTSI